MVEYNIITRETAEICNLTLSLIKQIEAVHTTGGAVDGAPSKRTEHTVSGLGERYRSCKIRDRDSPVPERAL